MEELTFRLRHYTGINNKINCHNYSSLKLMYAQFFNIIIDALLLRSMELSTRGDAGLLLGREAVVEFVNPSFLNSKIY